VTPPFGTIDTPADNSSGVAGGIGVTGWALDNLQVASVRVWRDPVAGESGLVYIGDATFVDGARPDVAAAFAGSPFNTRAGWGYLLLTNMLPNSNGNGGRGNGTYRLHAIAHDAAGNTSALGSRTITCTNATATKPFGAIDTPAPGASISGTWYPNFAWALTPAPASIPIDGSTLQVYVDGKRFGQPVYNVYRSDIATLFPAYANSSGAIGYYIINTTQLANGLHSIAWSVTDNAGRVDGIGSRLFTVSNAPAALKAASSVKASAAWRSRRSAFAFRTGYDPAAPLQRIGIRNGRSFIRLPQGQRLEIHTPDGVDRACLLQNGECGPLPAGSMFDPDDGVLYWQADPVFRGDFDFDFRGTDRSGTVRVRISGERR
jgi:hypothetical protein